ncbi:oxygenase MpaB family protein, partial [Rhodococcus koreensis]
MTKAIESPAENDAVERHPYDYFYRPGMELRPAPPRSVPSDDWFALRKRVFSDYIEVLEKPKPTPLTRLLDDHYWQGDELMDNVAVMGRRIGMANFRPMFNQALDEGIDKVKNPPAELVALFEQLDRVPEWLDRDAFERGRQFWVNGTMFGKIGGTLINQVFTTEGEAVSASVGATGRFQRDMDRRMVENLEVMASLARPDAADRFSHTFKTIVRVRLMHTMIRLGLRKKWGEENFAHSGHPISNTDLVTGSPAFGILNQLLDASFGWKVTMRDLDDVNMWWNYLAYLFGVEERILPRNGMESIELFNHILSTHGKASRWSKDLQDAFAEFTIELATSSDSKATNLFMKKVYLPLYTGLAVEVSGEPLGFRTMAGMGYSEKQMRRQAAVARRLAHAAVPVMSLIDRRPGQQQRWAEYAAEGDPALNAQEKAINE